MTEAFDYLGNDPSHWRSIAEALAYNANLLTQHRHLHGEDQKQYHQRHKISSVDMAFASLVLWGYTLESFLKCFLLKRGGSLTKEGKFVGNKKHNLVQMANDVGFPLTDPQRRILESLSIIVKWSGRYPIGTNPEATSLTHYWSEPQDDNDLKDLIESLRVEIDSSLI